MINRMVYDSSASERRSYLSSFFDGYFLPHVAQARTMTQEPLIEYTKPESEYIRAAWKDTFGALNTAMVQYAEEN